MHPLLDRQLARLRLDTEPRDQRWQELLERVSRAYTAADQERYLLERSLEITSREMRELYEGLKESSEQRYLELFENANDVIYTVDLQGNFTRANRAAEQLTGFSQEELQERHFS